MIAVRISALMLNDFPLKKCASPNNVSGIDRHQCQDLRVFIDLLGILHFKLCHLLFPRLHDISGFLQRLEPNPHNKGSQRSLDEMSYLSHKQEKGWHMSHHHIKLQKWRNAVVRHKQTSLSSPWMPLLKESMWRTFLPIELRLPCSYTCVFDPTFLFFLSLLLLSFTPHFQIRN